MTLNFNGWRRCYRSRHPHDWNIFTGQKNVTILPKPAVIPLESCRWHLTAVERLDRLEAEEVEVEVEAESEHEK